MLKAVVLALFILIPSSLALAWPHGSEIAQLNIYGPASTDQPHGISVNNQGKVSIYTQTSSQTFDHMDNGRRLALESDLLSVATAGPLVDTTPQAPTCTDQPTMDYNLVNPDGSVTTLIHYFHCHLLVASDPSPGDGIADRISRLKQALDGFLAETEFGN